MIRITTGELNHVASALVAMPTFMHEQFNAHSEHLEVLTDGELLKAVWTTWRLPERPGVLNFAAYCVPGYENAARYGQRVIDHIWSRARPNEVLRLVDSFPRTEMTAWLIQNETFLLDRQTAGTPLDMETLHAPESQVYAGRVLTYKDLLQRPKLLDEFAVRLYQRVRREYSLNADMLSAQVILDRLGEIQLADAPLLLVDDSTTVAFATSTRGEHGLARVEVMGATAPHYLRILLPFVFNYLRRIYPHVTLVWRSDDTVSAEVRRWLPLGPAPVYEAYYALRPVRLTDKA